MTAVTICSDFQFSRSVVSDSLRPHGLQQARHPCPSPNPSLLKLMPIVSDHLILCCLLFRPPSTFTCIRVFSNELVLHIRWPNIGVSASASVLPMNIQDWFPLGWTVWISLLSRGLSRVFSNTTAHLYYPHMGFSPPSTQETLPFISPSQRAHFSSLSQIIIIIKILFDCISLRISYF